MLYSYNPATQELIWQGKEATESDIDSAVFDAREAFEKWSFLPLEERFHFLNLFRSVLQESMPTLAETLSKETGKPLWEAKSEIQSMIHKVSISWEAYKDRCPQREQILPGARSITRHRPHGVLAIFGPYNFPGHLPHGHIIPALLAGNTVVWKPSELTPLFAETLMQCWEKIHLPFGVIRLVQGGKTTGQALIRHPAIQGVLFTGSDQTGLYLSEFFARQPQKILALEMGGNNPLLIGSIQDQKTAAYLTIQSAYLTSGQRCTCARRLILQEHQADHFLPILIDKIKRLSIGPYTQHPEPFMGPVISHQQVEALLEKQRILKSKGGKSLVEMTSPLPGTGFITPGLMDVTTLANREDEEIFGPFLQVIRVKNLEEALLEANRTKFGLAAGILSEDQKEYDYFYRHIRAGVINWNVPLTGASSSAPFGGIKSSGNYRPSAYYAADYCSYPVASLENETLNMPATLSPGVSDGNEF